MHRPHSLFVIAELPDYAFDDAQLERDSNVDFARVEFACEVALDKVDEEHEFGFVCDFFDRGGLWEVGRYGVVGGVVGYAVVLLGVEDDGGGGGRHWWHPRG